MGATRLDRVALVVDDLDAVVRSLREVLAIELTVLDVPELGLRAAIGSSGIELVQKIAEPVRSERYWKPPIAGLCFHVEDLDEAAERMESAGFPLVQTVRTPGGLRELMYGNGFHGFPVVLHASDGDLVRDVVGDGDEAYTIEVDWKS